MNKIQTDDVQFVTVYVKCNNYADLAIQLGLQQTSVQARASKLRKAGVNLVPYERKKKEIDVAGLNGLISR
jgi:hypothetical protein